MPSSGRIQEVDALRGFAIFLVVLGHAIIYFPVNLHQDFLCNAIFNWLSSVHMPLFFVIAGFCYSCRYYKSYVLKKFLRLVVPYAAFNLMDMLPRQLLASMVNRPKPFTESIINAILYGGELWFIYALFIIFMIYPFIDRLINSSRVSRIVAAVILFGVSLHGVRVSIFLVDKVAFYLFFFHLGVMMRSSAGGGWLRLEFPAYALPLSLCLWLVVLHGVHGFGAITALLGILTCYLMTKYNVFNDMFSRFGAYSLQLYLLNGFTLGISRAIICSVLHVHNPAVIILFNMMIDFFASYLLIKHVLMKSRVLRLLMGA